MQFIINKEKQQINVFDGEWIISMLYFIPSFFVWEFNSNITKDNPIIINKDENDVFYSNIEWFMNQQYVFYSKYAYKTNNKCVWLSEHCFDMENDEEVSKTSRLIIERKEDNFVIYPSIPYIEDNDFPHRSTPVSFAPAGNGYCVKNLKTNTNLQDDIINVFYHTLNNEKIIGNKRMIKKNNNK